jgi:hypothetical protein
MPRPFLLFLSVSLAACASEPGSSPAWKNPADGSAPTLSDTSDCRAEARRMSELRYPPRPVPRASGTAQPDYRQEDPDRFPAEVRFYEQCLERKGFRRA